MKYCSQDYQSDAEYNVNDYVPPLEQGRSFENKFQFLNLAPSFSVPWIHYCRKKGETKQVTGGLHQGGNRSKSCASIHCRNPLLIDV